MQKLRLAALAVIATGGGLLAADRPVQAQSTTTNYCCTQTVSQWGPDKIVQSCCYPTGCKVTSAGCVQVE